MPSVFFGRASIAKTSLSRTNGMVRYLMSHSWNDMELLGESCYDHSPWRPWRPFNAGYAKTEYRLYHAVKRLEIRNLLDRSFESTMNIPCVAWASSPKARVGCGNSARPDLWRGSWVTVIPTPTLLPLACAPN